MTFLSFILRGLFTGVFLLLVFRFFLWIVAPSVEQATDPFAVQVYTLVLPVLPFIDMVLWVALLPVTLTQNLFATLFPAVQSGWFPSVSVVHFFADIRLFLENIMPGFSDTSVGQGLSEMTFPGIIHWNYMVALVFWVVIEQFAEILMRGGHNAVREIQHRFRIMKVEQGHKREQQRIEDFRQAQEAAYLREEQLKRLQARPENTVRPVIDALKEESTSLQQRINRDTLTGLYNHGYFSSHLGKVLANARYTKHAVALILVDLDHFKAINDTHGHPFGDQVLKNVAAAIESVVRPLAERAVVCRQGGEEMSVVLTHTSPQEAQGIGEAIRQKISEIAFISKPEVGVTASIGVACVLFAPGASNSELDVSWLNKQADGLLYAAKQKGRNRVESTVFS